MLWILVASSPARAQHRYWPTGLQLSVDVATPLYYKYYQKTAPQYEFNASIAFASLMLEGDYGWGSIQRKEFDPTTGTRSAYTSEGKYFRAGLNYNLLQDTPDKNVAFLGVRYAASSFQDYNSVGQLQGGRFPTDERGRALEAHWYEAVAGVKVKVWKLLYVGATVRYKFGLHIDGADAYLPHDVLGWGLYDEEAFGVNYYLSLRIPFVRSTLPRQSHQE